jgi:hypothetical protein
MRTARFLAAGLFLLSSMTLVTGCSGEVVSPDANMTEEVDPALTDDSTMIEETGDGDVLTE